MYPHPNPLKVRLAQGKRIGGLFIQSPCADNVEIAASAGIDYVIIDLEHGSIGFSDAIMLIRAAEAAGVVPVVRLPDHDPATIRKVVENGAMGLYVPGVESGAQARAVVAAAQYRDGDNGGRRGACPDVRATRRRGGEWTDFVRWSNENVVLFLIVESLAGIAQLDDIAATPGVDGLLFGRFDLAHELGDCGGRYSAAVDAHYASFCSAAAAAGVAYGARLDKSRQPEASIRAFEERALIFNLGSDRGRLYGALREACATLGA